jgi:hypothetical protein
VAIAQDLALEGRDEADAEDYLEALDATIAAAAESGLYSIVQLSLISSVLPTGVGPSGDVYDPALPDADSIELWALLAQRYANEPAVIFDLFRSPHDPDLGDSTSIVLPSITWSVWKRWVLAMLGEIRREHPRALVIARGLDRGRDLSGFPLRLSDDNLAANVIYSAHIGSSDDAQVLRALERIGRTHAVGVFTWTARPIEVTRVQALGRRLASAGYHWVADGWNDAAMPLIRSRHGRFEPTQLGRAFELAASQPRPKTGRLDALLYERELEEMSADF